MHDKTRPKAFDLGFHCLHFQLRLNKLSPIFYNLRLLQPFCNNLCNKFQLQCYQYKCLTLPAADANVLTKITNTNKIISAPSSVSL